MNDIQILVVHSMGVHIIVWVWFGVIALFNVSVMHSFQNWFQILAISNIVLFQHYYLTHFCYHAFFSKQSSYILVIFYI